MKLFQFFKLPLCLITSLSLLTSSVFSYDESKNQTKNWYDDAVSYCLENNLLSEYLQDNSLLQEPVTWDILSQSLSDLTTNYSEDLYAVEVDSCSPVNWAKAFSIMDDSLTKEDIVTRLDVANALTAFLDKSNVSTLPPLSTSSFSDFSSIPETYKNGVLFVESNSFMNGYNNGTFGGNNPLSICQLAQILYNGREILSNVVMDKLFSLDESQIEYIVLQNGNTGNKETITDPTTLSTIIQLLNSFRFDSTQRVNSEGWSYRIILCFSSGKETYFCISPDSVTLNTAEYISAVEHFSSILPLFK